MKLKNINSDNFKLLRDKLIQILNHIIEKYNLNIGVNKKLILDKYVKDQKYMLYLFFNYKENINNIDEQIIINTLIYIIKIFLDHYNIKYDEIYNITNNLEIENDDINYNEYLKDGFVVSDEDNDDEDNDDEDINEEDYNEDDDENDDDNEDINEYDNDEDDEDINEEDYDEDINNIFIKKYSKKIIEENKEYLQNISINKINNLLDEFINDLKNKIKKFIN